jgi:hypothetical protein
MAEERHSNDSSDPTPSTHVEGYWLWARRRQGSYPDTSARSGKWMVFVPVEDIDRWWAAIKQATEQGRLGSSAKVSTARPNPNTLNSKKRVIIVYTYDGYARADVMQVRTVLRELGITWPISYKLDIATRAGQYSFTGAKVSLYRE